MCHALEKPRKNSPQKNVHVTTKRSTGTTKHTKKGDPNSKRSIEKAHDSANSLVSVHILSDVLDEDNLELSDQDSTAGRDKDSTASRGSTLGLNEDSAGSLPLNCHDSTGPLPLNCQDSTGPLPHHFRDSTSDATSLLPHSRYSTLGLNEDSAGSLPLNCHDSTGPFPRNFRDSTLGLNQDFTVHHNQDRHSSWHNRELHYPQYPMDCSMSNYGNNNPVSPTSSEYNMQFSDRSSASYSFYHMPQFMTDQHSRWSSGASYVEVYFILAPS